MDFRNDIRAKNSRGLRNNNPLNLRPVGFSYQGQTGVDSKGHAIFTDIVFGLRAGTLDLYAKYFVRGLKSFAAIIKIFAPSSDGNNEAAYVQQLKKITGITTNDISLSGSNIESILKAFTVVELGENYSNMIPQKDFVKGINAANKEGLKVAAGAGGSFLIVVLVTMAIFFAKNKK
jgi:hypothetical protein